MKNYRNPVEITIQLQFKLFDTTTQIYHCIKGKRKLKLIKMKYSTLFSWLLLFAPLIHAFLSPTIFNSPSVRDVMSMLDQDAPKSRYLIRARSPFSFITDGDRVLKDVFDSWESAGSSGPSKLALDVKESDTHYDLYMDAPGVDKDATKIEIKDHILTISTERKALEVTEKEKFNRLERFVGSSSRSIRLAEDVDEDNVEASYIHGVLQIRLPKKEVEDPSKKVKQIQIK